MAEEDTPTFPRFLARIRPASLVLWIVSGVCVIWLVVVMAASKRPDIATDSKVEGKYYRVKVALAHEGKPIDFDVVVSCNPKVTPHAYDGATVEIAGMYPLVYAMPIEAGHAVLLRTAPISDPSVTCQGGTTANGQVPKDWLPFIVWYDDAEDLSHGVGYVTSDAYHNASSQLAFKGAVVEAATRADFDRFLSTAPRNIIPIAKAGWMSNPHPERISSIADLPPEIARKPGRAWIYSLGMCFGAMRLPLTEAQKTILRSLKPPEASGIWTFEAPVNNNDIRREKLGIFLPYFPGIYDNNYVSNSYKNVSIVLPIQVDFSLSRVGSPRLHAGKNASILDIRNANNTAGMMYCDAISPKIESIFRKIDVTNYEKQTCYIDGIKIRSSGGYCYDAGLVAYSDEDFIILGLPPIVIYAR